MEINKIYCMEVARAKDADRHSIPNMVIAQNDLRDGKQVKLNLRKGRDSMQQSTIGKNSNDGI